MPITGANGGIIGADNTPSAAPTAGCVTAVTSTGCYSPTSTSATVVVVAGGGGAGTGGGGAGGVVVVTCHPLPGSAIPVTIGAGGAASTTVSATNGADSIFGSTTPITAKGGGGAGGSNSGPHKGKSGGSGGGGGDDGSAIAGGTLATNHGCTRAGFSGGQGDHGTGGGGGGAGGGGGKRGLGGFGRTFVPLGVPECIGEKGFLGGGGAGWNYNYGESATLAVISACRTATPYSKLPYAVQGAGFAGGMGGGGAADAGRVPNRHPSTPTCAVTNATAGIANTGGGGGSGKGAGTSQAGGSGVVLVITSASATLNSGVYNIKEQYAAVRGSRWI